MEITNWVPAVGEEIMISPDIISMDMPLVTRFMTRYAGNTDEVKLVYVPEKNPDPRRRFDVFAFGFWWPSCAVMPTSPISVCSENDLDDLLGLVPGNEL